MTVPKTSLFITRHGFSEHNRRDDVFMGRWPESRLTDQGREEARQLGERLKEKNLHRLVSSSLPRTMETAQIIAECCGITDIYPEDAFWELSKGDWEGKKAKPLSGDDRARERADPFDFRYGKGGESYRDVVTRVAPVFENWVEKFPGERLLFVLHGDVIRAVLFHLIQFPEHKIADFQTDPCSLNEFGWDGARYTILRLNDTSHIK